MQESKQDRRIRRTRRLLKESLIQLMQEKEFMNISVRVLRQKKRKQKIIPDTLIHSSVRPIMGIPFRGLVILSE